MATKLPNGGYITPNLTVYRPDGTMDRQETMRYRAGMRAGNPISNFAGGMGVDRVWPPTPYGGDC